MRHLLLTVAFFAISGFMYAQQTVQQQAAVFHYTLKVTDVGTWSDDGTVKVVQTILKPIFDAPPKMNEQGAFVITTNFPIKEEKTSLILANEGFDLADFRMRTDIDSDATTVETE